MSAPTEESPADAQDKLKKVKYAVMFGYCGAGYHGLQSNADPNHATIEDEMVKSFHAAGLISSDNMEGNTMQKLGWQRASRTDKGVSALRNLVSAKLLRQPEGDEACIPRLNAHLPPAIRVFGLLPVTASFNSHLHCTGREYEYYLPTYCMLNHGAFVDLFSHDLAPSAPSKEVMDATIETATGEGDTEDQDSAAGAKRGRPAATAPAAQERTDDADVERCYMFKSIPADAMARLRAHRISEAVLKRARELFRMFEGTQSFHNFTPRGNPSNPSMMRFMKRIEVSDPFVVRVSRASMDFVSDDIPASEDIVELEYVRVKLAGQSFMLNQIRKMIGTVITILAADLDGGYLRSCLETTVVRGTPMAPANGLMLVDLFFERYNFTLERIQGEGRNAADRKPVVMAECDADLVADVRKQVLRSIVREELSQNITGRWMRGVRFIARLAWSVNIG